MTDAPSFDAATSRSGCVKVRLSYRTFEPKHIRSHYLRVEVGAKPPFTEDVFILVPLDEAYDRLSAYQDIFTNLKLAGLIAALDELTSFEICEENQYTLAYWQKEPEKC